MGAVAPVAAHGDANERGGRWLFWLRGAVIRWLPRSSETELPRTMIRDLERHLQYRFRDVSLLVQSLKHRSYVYSNQGHGVDSNERLEYLGDAVLDVVVAEFLFRLYVDRREGALTQLRSLAVSRSVLTWGALSCRGQKSAMPAATTRTLSSATPLRHSSARFISTAACRRHEALSSALPSTTSMNFTDAKTSSISRANFSNTCRAWVLDIPNTRSRTKQVPITRRFSASKSVSPVRPSVMARAAARRKRSRWPLVTHYSVSVRFERISPLDRLGAGHGRSQHGDRRVAAGDRAIVG